MTIKAADARFARRLFPSKKWELRAAIVTNRRLSQNRLCSVGEFANRRRESRGTEIPH